MSDHSVHINQAPESRKVSRVTNDMSTDLGQTTSIEDNRSLAASHRSIQSSIAGSDRLLSQKGLIQRLEDRHPKYSFEEDSMNHSRPLSQDSVQPSHAILQLAKVSNESIKEMPAKAIVAFRHAKAWLDITLEHIDEIGDYAEAYFHRDDVQHLEDDYKAIRTQWTVSESKGYVDPKKIDDKEEEIDIAGLRYLDQESGTTLADSRKQGDNALITIYPYGLDRTHDQVVLTYIHELSHASTLGTDDIAYKDSRMFEAIPYFQGLGRKNADSYATLAAVFMARKPSELGAESVSAGDSLTSFSEDQVKYLRTTLGLTSAICKTSLEQLNPAIVNLKAAIERGSWDDSELVYWSIADEFSDDFVESDEDHDFDEVKATQALAVLEQLQTFITDTVIEILNQAQDMSFDGTVSFSYSMASGKVGPKFFTEPQPDTFLIELMAYESGSEDQHKLMVNVTKFLAKEENAELPGGL